MGTKMPIIMTVRGWLAPLALLLFVGSPCSSQVQFRTLFFPDGETRSSSGYDYYHPRLIIQEGAVVDVVCKSYRAVINGPLSAVGIYWTLTNTHESNHPIDHNIFPAERNYEKYHSVYVDGSSFDNPDAVKVQDTLRYTARREDDGKFLVCEGVDLNSDASPAVSSNDYIGNHVHLVVRPAPAPLRFQSTVLHKWRGGFIGRIDIPISDYYTSWKIVLKFRRQVYELFGGHFQVANEPCLHTRDCGDDVRKTWVIYNTFNNRVLNPGDDLHLTFVAKIFKKIDVGLVAKIDFYGYNQVFFTDYSSDAAGFSSSDIHVVPR